MMVKWQKGLEWLSELLTGRMGFYSLTIYLQTMRAHLGAKQQNSPLCKELRELEGPGHKLVPEDPDWQAILRVKRKVGRFR